METRPAPLDGMSGTDGIDEFRVSSPRDIGLLLKQLVDGSVLRTTRFIARAWPCVAARL